MNGSQDIKQITTDRKTDRQMQSNTLLLEEDHENEGVKRHTVSMIENFALLKTFAAYFIKNKCHICVYLSLHV
jgi:hypothetical protein